MWKAAILGTITGKIMIFMKTNRPSNDPTEFILLEKTIELTHISYDEGFFSIQYYVTDSYLLIFPLQAQTQPQGH